MLAVALALIATSIYIAVGSAQTAGTSSTNTQTNTLSVSGTGVATIAPDQAQVMLGAITQAATAQDAATANSKVVNGIIGQLESMGISSQSIVTVSYNIWPNYYYGQNGNQQQTITGYQASTELQVTLIDSNLTKLGGTVGHVIDAATGAGANQVYGIQFSATPQTMKSLNGQALQLAVQDASSKAQTMAGALGVKIVGVQSATESSPYSPPIYYASAAQAGSDKGTTIQPGAFSLTASVQVVYVIQ